MPQKISELIKGYLATFERSENTIRTYRHAFNKFVAIVGEDAELTLENYLLFLKRSRRLSPSTINIRKTAVMGLYRYYDSPDFPLLEKENKHRVKKYKPGLVFYNKEAVEVLLQYARGLTGDLISLRDKAFVLTLRDTGLRISEACRLTRGDIDLKSAKGVIVGKGDKKAIIRFSKESIRAIRAYHEARAAMDGASGKPIKTLPVFAHVTKTGRVLSIKPDGMRKAFHGRIAEAGLEIGIITPHTLRHYFVTTVLKQKNNLKMAQELARHESVTTTSRYAHLTDYELDEGYKDIFDT